MFYSKEESISADDLKILQTKRLINTVKRVFLFAFITSMRILEAY